MRETIAAQQIINILNIVRNDPMLTQYSPENRHGCKTPNTSDVMRLINKLNRFVESVSYGHYATEM